MIQKEFGPKHEKMEKEVKNSMREYLILLKLNPKKLTDTIGSLRQLSNKPIDGVNLRYTMNVFGVWDVGMWINAEGSDQALEFIQNKVKNMAGITEVYTVPTFPHGNETPIDEEKEKNEDCKLIATEA